MSRKKIKKYNFWGHFYDCLVNVQKSIQRLVTESNKKMIRKRAEKGQKVRFWRSINFCSMIFNKYFLTLVTKFSIYNFFLEC